MKVDALPRLPAHLAMVDSTGAAVRLSDLWSDGPLVICFLRHFG